MAPVKVAGPFLRFDLCHGKKKCFRPELNWRPSACEADVITTTLQKPLLTNFLLFICFLFDLNLYHDKTGAR